MENPSDKIRDFLQSEIMKTAGDISTVDNLVASGVIDSFDMVKMIMFIENEFGIKIEQEDLTEENFKTVESIAGFIARKKR